MGKLKRKLSSRSGETLTETLCALLVISLSSLLLATMISAATRLNASAVERDGRLYEGLTAAETRTGAGAGGTVTARDKATSGDTVFDVTWYGADGLWSYALNGTEGGGAP